MSGELQRGNPEIEAIIKTLEMFQKDPEEVKKTLLSKLLSLITGCISPKQ